MINIEPQVTGLFANLFRGRGDVYGHEEGRCVKEPLTHEVFQRHLDGVEAIGVYPMVPINNIYHVAWGCSDIDIEDYAGAKKIQSALQAVNVPSFIERSRSKGYHVWVFADRPVPASAMRRMFLCAHQVAEYPAREVNPKQETLASGQYGNYVRLPYYKALDMSDSHRRILDDTGTALPLAEFISLAIKGRTPIETINHLASLWKEPVASHTVINMNQSVAVADALTQLSPLGKVIWRDGPLPNKDRSTTLAKLGHECVRSCMSPSETKVVLQDADRRWGKYHLRPNGELEIDKLVVRVFS
jgi:hypothetical protein